jgi:MerR family transcriptional regulator, light-induced transcriptional regulator
MTEILFTTAELSTMLQVGSTTIKRWTDNGNLKCFRTPGGHRKVRAEDVYDFLQDYHYPISVQRIYEAMSTDDGVIRRMVREKDYQAFVSVCFSAALKGKKDDVRKLFHELYQNNMPLPLIFDEVLRPTLHRLADMNLHKIKSAEFQLALTVLASAIDRFTDFIIRPTAQKWEEILCLSAGNSYVEVELKALQTIIESNGKNVISLMPKIESETSLELIAVKEPKYVCLWISKAEGGPVLDERVHKLLDMVHQYGGNVILGGETQLLNAGEKFVEGRDSFCRTFGEVGNAFQIHPQTAEPLLEPTK